MYSKVITTSNYELSRGLHLKNIFKTGQLSQESVTEDFSATATDGKKYQVKHYNLDAIISVGYRIKSTVATRFRQWATQRLKDYLVQGYAINEKRLAQKQQEVEYLKTGIRIVSRAIEEAADGQNQEVFQLFSRELNFW